MWIYLVHVHNAPILYIMENEKKNHHLFPLLHESCGVINRTLILNIQPD